MIDLKLGFPTIIYNLFVNQINFKKQRFKCDLCSNNALPSLGDLSENDGHGKYIVSSRKQTMMSPEKLKGPTFDSQAKALKLMDVILGVSALDVDAIAIQDEILSPRTSLAALQ